MTHYSVLTDSRPSSFSLARAPSTIHPLARALLASASLLWLAGCDSGFISRNGPTRDAIIESSEIRVQTSGPRAGLGFALVRVDANVVSRLDSKDTPIRFASWMTDSGDPEVRVGVGDVLDVTIFEAGSGGLFIPPDAGSRPGNFVQIPPQQVGREGVITVPYAGRIQAAGRTPIEIQHAVETKLKDRAFEPQAVVSFAERRGNDVSVLGDVNTATRYSLDAGGDRVLSAIARAAGPKYAAFETLVTIQRRGRSSTCLMSEIVADPSQNIRLRPGDVVYVAREPRYFITVGATGQTTSLTQLDRRFPFNDYKLTLAQGLARAGGMQDGLANARGLFLYREEPAESLRKIGLNPPPSLGDKVPTVYMVDMTKADGLFLSNKVWMRNGDMIFASNAPAPDILKFLDLLVPFTQSASSVNNLAQ